MFALISTKSISTWKTTSKLSATSSSTQVGYQRQGVTFILICSVDQQICPLSITPLGCPLPPSQCPYRHTTPSQLNFKPPPPLPAHPREREKKLTVCKHYLRNLCKMGDNCEYTHDFNLRTMPECIWFVKQGKCELGGECLYFHPRDRRVECPDYNRGFCVLGPNCPRKHIRRRMCEAYAAGFCPDGRDCKLAQ